LSITKVRNRHNYSESKSDIIDYEADLIQNNAN